MRKMKRILALLLTGAIIGTGTACAPTNPGSKAESKESAGGTEAGKNGESGTKGQTDEVKKETGGQDMGQAAGQKVNTEDEITLTMSWWGGDSRHEATQKAIEAFEAKYPNIHIESSFSGWSGWEEKMGLAFSSGNADDIVQINWNWLTAFDGDGSVFQDLGQYSGVLDLTQFSDDILEQSKVNGEIHAVPVAMTARTMVWNKNTFDKAGIPLPSTWDELLAAGETFKTVLGDEYYPMMLTEYDRMIFMVWYLESMYGKEWVTDKKLNYTDEEIAAGFAMLKELEEKHVIPTIQMVKDYGADSFDKSDRWINGYWAGIHAWDTGIMPPKLSLPEDQQAGFVSTAMFTGLPNKGGFKKISMEFAITKTCEHPVEAAAFLNFILNEEEGVVAMAGERGVPASAAGLKILKDNDLIDPLVMETSKLALESNYYVMDPYFEDAELKTSGEGVYYKVMSAHSYGQMTDEEAVKALTEGINGVLNR